MTLGPGTEPGAHWWEESALTTEPFLLPNLFLTGTVVIKLNTYQHKIQALLILFL